MTWPSPDRAALEQRRGDGEREQDAAPAEIADQIEGMDGWAIGGTEGAEHPGRGEIVDVVARREREGAVLARTR